MSARRSSTMNFPSLLTLWHPDATRFAVRRCTIGELKQSGVPALVPSTTKMLHSSTSQLLNVPYILCLPLPFLFREKKGGIELWQWPKEAQ